MGRSLNRDELLRRFQIPSDEIYAGDNHWSPELNQRVLDWITSDFIPNSHYRVLAWCRPQIMELWSIFLIWLEKKKWHLDVRRINLDILQAFEKNLPTFGWSRSAIQLIEAVLICARKRLYTRKIMRCPIKVTTDTFSPLATGFFIKVADFRAIRQHFMKEGNDYEIVYFDLTTTETMIYLYAFALKGSNVAFEGERAFISLPDDRLDDRRYPCPSEVSRRLLRLLRSRNITAEEPIFEGVHKIRSIIREKIEHFCLKSNIPVFASELMAGFLNNFIVTHCDDSNLNTLEPIVYPWDNRAPSKEALRILDRFYREITENKRYRELTYAPHRAIIGLQPKSFMTC